MKRVKVMTGKAIVVVSGGPGFGKSSLLEELERRGYKTGQESAREIMIEQLQSGGDVLPDKNRKAFQEAVLNRRIRFYESVGDNEVAFSDRGIPDQLAFSVFRGFQPDALLLEKANEYRYFPVVFVCPPWEGIYQTDDVRDESFEEACRIHQFVCKAYSDLNYELVELPLVSIEGRADFILAYLETFGLI